MSEKIHETMQRVLVATGLTPAEIAHSTKNSLQNVNNWKNRGISKNGAISISQAHGLSVDWILTGQGEMKTGQGEPYLYSEPNGILSDKQIEIWTDSDTPPDGMIAIDFLANITASLGHGYINEEFTEKTQLWFSEQTLKKCNVNPKYAKAIHVTGDSMLPELTDGQVIAIDTSATRIFDGEIYAFRKGDEIKVKYLFKTHDGFKAISRNDDKLRYPDEIYTTSNIENENIEILGQFWWKSETRRIKR